MRGPYPIGTHSGQTRLTTWEDGRLRRGEWYKVTRKFIDSDGVTHPVDERWRFIVSDFCRNDNELLIAVQFDDAAEWRILLRWTLDGQAAVIESFQDYVLASK
jgi:hypothetical protein